MPKKLAMNPNERVDLGDYLLGANDYTKDSEEFFRERVLLAKRSAVLEGYRVHISDQSANPGQITVYNGVAADRDGALLNNEDAVNDARTVTLPGASTTFYVEVEFVEAESDTDSRAFFDPTFANTSPMPPGKEFPINTATRITPDWQIVSPVSTTGFDADADPNSVKIPIAIFITDGVNQITGASTPGLVQVNASTVSMEDVAVAASSIRVADSRLFPDIGTMQIDVGGSVESVSITANDRTNGIISFSPILVSAHNGGSIVRETGVTARFVREQTTSVPATTHPDWRRGLFRGNELAGAALSASKETFGSRSDLNLRNHKDHVDIIAAQLREMKFGNLRTDVDSTEPPSTFTSTRWYDNAGSIQGARGYTVTIGDGVLSFGDLNTTVDSLSDVIQQAYDSLPPIGGTIYVKAGTYTLDSTINTDDKSVTIIFDKGIVLPFTVSPTVLFNIAPTVFGVEFELIEFNKSPIPLTARNELTVTGNPILKFTDCRLGPLDITGASTVELYALRTRFTADYSKYAINMPTGTSITTEMIFKDCHFDGDEPPTGIWNGCLNNTLFDNCYFEMSTGGVQFINAAITTGDIEKVTFRNCEFDLATAVKTPFRFSSVGGAVRNMLFDTCKFDYDIPASAASALERTGFYFDGVGDKIAFLNCDFSECTNACAGNDGFTIRTVTAFENFIVSGCTFGDPPDGSITANNEIFLSFEDGSYYITNNFFSDFHKAISTAASAINEGITVITGNTFINDAPSQSVSKNLIAVDSAHDRNVIIANNYISMDANGTVGINFVGIDIINAANSPVIIHNNNINKIDGGPNASVYGIRYNQPASCKFEIIGNNIDNVKTADTGSGVAHGIFISSDNNIINSNIVGNNIQMTTGIVGTPHGVTCITVDSKASASSSIASTRVTLSNNILKIQAPVSTINGETLFLRVQGALVSNNYMQHGSTGAGSTFGMRFQGSYITIDNNVIDGSPNGSINSIEHTSSVSIEKSVFISITNNLLLSNIGMEDIIRLDTSAQTGSLSLKVNNNIMYTSVLNNSSAISLFLGDTDEQIQVNDNMIYEQTFQVSHKCIEIQGLGDLQRATGISVCNNNMRGAAGLTSSDRTIGTVPTGMGCIHVEYCNYVNICSNSIYSWTDSDTEGTSIWINNCDFNNIQSNLCQPGPSTTQDTITIVACDESLVQGNIVGGLGITGTIDFGLSSGTQVGDITSDSNKYS